LPRQAARGRDRGAGKAYNLLQHQRLMGYDLPVVAQADQVNARGNAVAVPVFAIPYDLMFPGRPGPFHQRPHQLALEVIHRKLDLRGPGEAVGDSRGWVEGIGVVLA
jgi:hypothetical protein